MAAEPDLPEFDDNPEPARATMVDLCNAWGHWQRELANVNAHGARANRPPPAASYAQLMALHTAIISQPKLLDRKVFEVYHLHCARNIKSEAARLGVSRKHFYGLLDSFRQRVCLAAGRMSQSIFEGTQP